MLVRFTAAGLVGLGVLELGLYGGECYVHHEPVEISQIALRCISFLLGIVVFVKARAVAEWISNKFDT